MAELYTKRVEVPAGLESANLASIEQTLAGLDQGNGRLGNPFIGSPNLRRDPLGRLDQISQLGQIRSLNSYPAEPVSPFDVAFDGQEVGNRREPSHRDWFERGEEFLERLASPQNANFPALQKTSAGMLLITSRMPRFGQLLASWIERLVAWSDRVVSLEKPLVSAAELKNIETAIIVDFRKDMQWLLTANQVRMAEFAPWLNEFNQWRSSLLRYLEYPSLLQRDELITNFTKLDRTLELLAERGAVTQSARMTISNALHRYLLDLIIVMD